ncbi:uncharacterized protein LOC136087006 [Hydra vulgaris]|uniref:Uncharacterized protein LOC136087006 n=1 Tax=Hydra vulgaris TaxID=6087 RepID=A0ABM4CUH9_HYDVU
MPKYKSSFQEIWLSNVSYTSWLQKDKNPSLARCKVCSKLFSVAAMGIKAVDAHARGVKHIERLPQEGYSVLFKETVQSEPQKPISSKQCNISDMLQKEKVLKAELICCLDIVQSKYSFRSSENKSKQFASMFPDSKIANNFSCGRTKSGYIVTHGLAPYLKKILLGDLNKLDNFVCLFDESYNKVVKKGQMDLHVRYWNEESNTVCTRYYTSEFMGKAAAPDILNMFKSCMIGLNDEKMLQANELSTLIDIGTCGLHTINGALQTGAKATGWNIKKLLSSIYQIFHESPSRASDYERIAGATSSDFPYMFCSTRWAENQSVAKKAIQVWSKVVLVVDYWKSLPKSKQPGYGTSGQNTSFEHLSARANEVLVPLKLKFFEEISANLNAFLVSFQTDKPMTPFLVVTLEELLRNFYAKFIRLDVLANAKTTTSLLKIDLSNCANRLLTSKIDVGFSLKYDLLQLKSKGKITEVQIDKFKSEVCDFLVSMCTHIIEKSPLSSLVARCLMCISPSFMVEFPEKCEYFFEKLLMKLVTYKKIRASVGDLAKNEYSRFCKIVVVDNKELFLTFDKDKDRLDYFLWKYTDLKLYTNLQQIFKIVLILSHGQAQVERGFSSNKSLVDDNMSTDTIISLRSIQDYLTFYGLMAHEVEITKDLLYSCKQARKRYFDDQRSKALSAEKAEKIEAKQKVIEDIEIVNTEIRQALSMIENLKKSSDEIGFRAEKRIALDDIKADISKSNALKRAAFEKQESLEKLYVKKKNLVKKKNELL